MCYNIREFDDSEYNGPLYVDTPIEKANEYLRMDKLEWTDVLPIEERVKYYNNEYHE